MTKIWEETSRAEGEAAAEPVVKPITSILALQNETFPEENCLTRCKILRLSILHPKFLTFMDNPTQKPKQNKYVHFKKEEEDKIFSFLSSNVETFLSPYVNTNFKRRSDGFFIEMGTLLNKTREACKSKLQKI